MKIPSFIARMLRGLVQALVRFYYPRIEVGGGGRVPEKGPVLVVANHPNSVLDPIVVGIAAGRPVKFLAKAPLFEVPVFGSLIRALGMVPAYRGSDSPDPRADRVKNLESLKIAAGALAEHGGTVMGVFPEGKSHDDPQLAMVRSGASRMVMQAVEAGVRGLKIVPMGLNYERKDRFRSVVWVELGEAIDVDEWWQTHGGEGREAMRALTPEIDRRLKDVVVHLDDATWGPLLEEVEGLIPARVGLRSTGLLQMRKRVAQAINGYYQQDPAKAEALAQRVRAWRTKREAVGLPRDARFFRQPLWRRGLAVCGDTVRLPVALGLGALGLIHHLVPHLVARFWAARLDQPGRVTVALHRLLVGLPVHLTWYLGVTIWMLATFQSWVAWGWLAMMPGAGLAAVWAGRRLRVVVPIWWAEAKLLPQRERGEALRQERAELVASLLALAEDFPEIEPEARRSRMVKPPLWLTLLVTAMLAVIGSIFVAWLMRDRPLEWWRTGAPALHTMTPTRLKDQMGRDERGLEAVIDGLGELESRFRVFEAQLHAGERSYYRPEDDDEMRRMLVSFLSYRSALLRTVWGYQRFDQLVDEPTRLRALLLHYTAAAVLYDYSARFVLAFASSDEAQRKLNEGEPRWDLAPGTYDRIRANLASIAHREWLEAGWVHYHESLPAWTRLGMGPVNGGRAAKFHDAIIEAGRRTAALKTQIFRFKVETAFSHVKDAAGGSYYRASAAISSLIGDAKIRAPRGNQALVTPELMERLRPMLQPGDVLIERRNWYLSNAFLPGYWPHAAMYVGTPDDLRAMGLDKDRAVAAKLEEFSGADAAGHGFAVIEAMSEGVVFTSVEHSIGEADAVAVLRPRLTEAQKRNAIARAFSHAGKPYDFDFDFFSSDKLVCTEVVYRSYGDELNLPLQDILGRQTLPAIEIVRAWADATDDAQEWDFVAFLDGNERTGRCTWADEEALRASLKRAALTWLN